MSNESERGVRQIVVLGTGGTIAGSAASGTDNLGYSAGTVSVDHLIAGIDAPVGYLLAAEQVAQLDSKDMDHATWRVLAICCRRWLADDSVAGIVITHGTDTLEETAFFLSQVLAAGKPVVLTCAMRPASSLSPDGPQNVRDALAVAASADATGVMVVCAGVVHAAGDVQKVHTYRLDAFSSGVSGPLGHVEEGQVRLARAWPRAGSGVVDLMAAVEAAEVDDWPRVEIVTSHAGAQGGMLDALLAARRSGSLRLDGIVVAATGNGTIHRTLKPVLEQAESAGVAVRRATRCAEGHILPTTDAEFLDSGALTPVKARVRLMLDLLAADTAT